jgi:iron complex outermembrane receptor protein
VGVRVVRTEGDLERLPDRAEPATWRNLPAFPWGGFVQQTSIENNHTKVLPSLNLKLDVNKDVVARFGLSRTMTRPDFGALGGTVSADRRNPYRQRRQRETEACHVEQHRCHRAVVLRTARLGVGRPVLHGPARLRRLRQSAPAPSSTAARRSSPATRCSPPTRSRRLSTSVPASRALNWQLQVPLGAGFGVDGNVTLADSKQAFGSCPAMQTATSSSRATCWARRK